MNPWVLLDQTEVQGDGGEMALYQRAFEFSISQEKEKGHVLIGESRYRSLKGETNHF